MKSIELLQNEGILLFLDHEKLLNQYYLVAVSTLLFDIFHNNKNIS